MSLHYSLDALDTLFVVFAFLFQAVLIIHFAFRRWAFAAALRYGFLVYALAVPALAISVAQMAGGKPWYLWLGGCLFAVWGLFGYWVEYIRRIDWRPGGHRSVFALYITLYLATVMFYWWPLATLARPLWYAYGFQFLVSTILNISSHRAQERPRLVS
jgi:hypothetical protein